jgi:hypothetical protein
MAKKKIYGFERLHKEESIAIPYDNDEKINKYRQRRRLNQCIWQYIKYYGLDWNYFIADTGDNFVIYRNTPVCNG